MEVRASVTVELGRAHGLDDRDPNGEPGSCVKLALAVPAPCKRDDRCRRKHASYPHGPILFDPAYRVQPSEGLRPSPIASNAITR